MATSVVPGTYGDISHIPRFTVDSQGRITVASCVDIQYTYVKTNNSSSFNGYIWPSSDGATNTALTTDGAGSLSWQPVPTNAIPCSEFTAKGDILTATAASTPFALPVGADGLVLMANSLTATGLCWGTIPTPYIPCSCISAKGSLITGSGPGAPVALFPGSNGQVLVACALCPSGLTWVNSSLTPGSIPCSCVTAKGVVLTGTGPGLPTALPVGGDGQVLAADSTTGTGLKWITPCQGTVTCVGTGYGLTGGPFTNSGVISVCVGCFIPQNLVSGKGAILAGSLANVAAALPVGANGQTLMACSACSLGLTWQTITYPYLPCSIMTGHGSLLTATSGNAPVILPSGANDQVLTVCSSCTQGLAWRDVYDLALLRVVPVPPMSSSPGAPGQVAYDNTTFYWYSGGGWRKVTADAYPW